MQRRAVNDGYYPYFCVSSSQWDVQLKNISCQSDHIHQHIKTPKENFYCVTPISISRNGIM